MADAEDREAIDPNEIDLTGVMEYMQRNNLSLMKLIIEAVTETESGQPPATVMVAEQRSLSEDVMPSDLGLGGVFIVVEYP